MQTRRARSIEKFLSLAISTAIALLILATTLPNAAVAQSKALDKKALEEELRLRDKVDQALRWYHPFSPEVRAGDLLTFLAVSVSAITLLFTLMRDRALRRKEYADRIRHGAALIAVKADRWREISSHFFDELQPIIVDTDIKLKSDPLESIRDFWWKEVASIYAKTRKSILDEEIENSYLDFYGYDPTIQQIFFGAMSKLRAIDTEVHKSFLLDTQEIIDSTTLPYFSSKLGNPLRRSGKTHRQDLDSQMHEVVTALRVSLVKIMSASDEDILNGLPRVSSLAAATDVNASRKVKLDATRPATRWALLIGINHCPKIGKPLRGPSNDAAMFADLLQNKFGFTPENIVRLNDASATRAGIINALDWISTSTQPGDFVLFYFSGNGSQVTPDKAKSDYLLATLVPYDSGREEGQRFDITVTELNRYLSRISKSRRLVVTLDTCHSGGIGEGQNALPALHPVDDSLPVLPSRGLDHPSDSTEPWRITQLEAQLPLAGDYTLLTACHKDELAYEFRSPNDRPHGVFSYFLISALAKASPTSTYRQIFEDVSTEVSRNFQNQRPQIEGNVDHKISELFGRQTEEIRPTSQTLSPPTILETPSRDPDNSVV